MTRRIRLTNGRYTFVSDHRYQELRQFSWRFVSCNIRRNQRNGYAMRSEIDNNGKRVEIPMHRQIMECVVRDGIIIDHWDGNGLHNTDENLRECTHSQNSQNQQLRLENTSGYKGVSWHKLYRMWIASITVNGKTTCLGKFRNKKEAAIAYDKAAREYHGEFANTNFTEATMTAIPNIYLRNPTAISNGGLAIAHTQEYLQSYLEQGFTIIDRKQYRTLMREYKESLLVPSLRRKNKHP